MSEEMDDIKNNFNRDFDSIQSVIEQMKLTLEKVKALSFMAGWDAHEKDHDRKLNHALQDYLQKYES